MTNLNQEPVVVDEAAQLPLAMRAANFVRDVMDMGASVVRVLPTESLTKKGDHFRHYGPGERVNAHTTPQFDNEHTYHL